MKDLLAGVRAKLDRSLEIVNILKIESEVYFKQSPIRLEKEHRNSGLEYSLVAYGESFPPARFAIVAGEVVHHLRSSLDHLIHALVLNNDGKPGKFNQFPICKTERAFKDACNRRQLDGISASSKALVASVQPFTSSTPDDTVLYVVNEFDNADKHQLLVVVSTLADVSENIVIGTDMAIAATTERLGKSPNIVGFGPFGPQKMSPDGVPIFTIKLQEPAPEITAEASVKPFLAFDQCGLVKFAPLVSTLQKLVHGTGHTVNLFSKEFQ